MTTNWLTKKWWVERITPKHTEEVKPGLFIQRIKGESIMSRLDKTVKGHQKEIVYDRYRQITPAAWEGKVNKKILIFGVSPVKSFMMFAIIMMLAWSYYHDTKATIDFQYQFATNYTYRSVYCSSLSSPEKLNPTLFNLSNLNLTITGAKT